MPHLLVLKGPYQGDRIQLNKERIVFGRNADCDVVLNIPAVSREHACVVRVPDGKQFKYYVEDLHSRNFTFLNNQKIPEENPRVLLQNNDRIRVCDFLCSYHDAAPVKPLPAELRPEEPEEEIEQDTSTIEASFSQPNNLLLETQSTEKLKALIDISNNLSMTLELDELLPKIVDRLFELFKQADRGFIILREEPSGRLNPKVIRTRRVQDEANARFSRSIVKQCMESVKAMLIDDATSDSRFALSQSIADFRIRSVMCAPLASQDGQAVGVIQLDTQDRGKKFTEEDLKLLFSVGRQAYISLENARLHADLMARERLKQELALAHQVQLSILPARLPEIPDYQFFAHYEAAQAVGGDYYGFIPLPQRQRLAMMLGDVAGKGVAAALLMAKISADARFCMLTEADPAVAITKLNDLLHEAGQTDRFVTLVAALLDPHEHTVTLVNAGHLSPLIYRHATGEVEEAMDNEIVGLPLGVLEGYTYQACQIALQPGDCLLAFTDGVTEAMDTQNRQIGMEGIHKALQGGPMPPRDLGERIVKLVKQHAAGRSQHDDITLVCLGRTCEASAKGSQSPLSS
jgi:sigma-B regulation protein RsbU (phosphoserine phosphatase)